MAQFLGTITKVLVSQPTVRWTNTYNFTAASFTDAIGKLFTGVLPLERAIHTEDVEFVRLNVNSVGTGPGPGRSDTISSLGLAGSDPTIQLPLWNVARVILIDAENKPESKYLRLPLQEDDVTGMFLDGGLVTLIGTDYVTPLIGLGYITGPGGEGIIEGVVQEKIQMRQQGWHRRTRPGFHRGYVPNV